MNVIISKFYHQKASLLTYLGYVQQRDEMEDVHKLRLTIRRNRALFSFLSFSLEGKFDKDKAFEIYSVIFHLAGHVREAQVNLAQMGKYEVDYLKPFLDNQAEYLKEGQNQLQKAIAEFDRQRLDREEDTFLNMAGSLDDQWISHQISAYTDYKMIKVNQLKNGVIDDHALHKIRIHLRMIADVLWIFKKSEKEKEPVISTTDLSTINDRLGVWHDEAVLLETLRFYSQKQLQNDLMLESFIKRRQKHCDEKKEQILDLLRGLDTGLTHLLSGY